MRNYKASIILHGQLAGTLNSGFRFQYDNTYVENGGSTINFSLPIALEPSDSKNTW